MTGTRYRSSFSLDPARWAALAAGLLTTAAAWAQAPAIIARVPARHAVAAPRPANVAVTFSQPMSGAPASVGALRVFGGSTGKRPGAASAAGSTLTLNPTTDFRPGERVDVTVTTAAQSSEEMNLAVPHVYQFIAAAGAGPGLFSSGTDLPAGAVSTAVVTGDVDGDGDADLLAVNAGSNTVSVLLNGGAGTFSPGAPVVVGANPINAALADLDGDTDLDLLVVNYTDNAVGIYLNSGSGSFSSAGSVAVGSAPTSVAPGDVDGDGDLDFVAVNSDVSANSVSVRLNNGSGSFSSAADVATSFQPISATLVDVDHDGDLDLLATSRVADHVNMALNNGTGTFTPTAVTNVGDQPFDLLAADLDSDGDADLVTANFGAGTASIRFNNGAGIFSGTQNVATGAGVYDLTLGDVDGDGDLDLLVANNTANTVSVRLNNGAGVFSGSQDVATGATPAGVVVADLDGDGDLDLATANHGGTVSVRLNRALATTWTGVVSTDWFTAGNWTDGVPTSTLDASIPGGAPRYPVVALGTASTKSLSIAAAASLTLSGGTLDLKGDFANGGTFTQSGGVVSTSGAGGQTLGGAATTMFRELTIGPAGGSLTGAVRVSRVLKLTGSLTGGSNLTLLSDPTGTALVINAGGTVSGAATVQCWQSTSPYAGTGYHHLSSPVAGSTVADLTCPGFVPRVNTAYNTIPTPTLPANQMPNVFGYDETRGGAVPDFDLGYYSPASLAAALVVGRGYFTYLPGGRTPDFVGTLTTGDVLMSGLTKTGNFTGQDEKSGWHLLGNPFPSPLDWDLISVPAGMSSSVSVFQPTGANSGIFLTRAGGVGSLTDGVLPLGQGFFARVTGAGPVDFTIPNAARVTTPGSPAHYRPAETRPRLALTLHQTGAPALETDEATVYFDAAATPAVDDRFDGAKPAHNLGVPTLVSLTTTGAELAVNGLPTTALTSGTTVELLLDLPTAGSYVLSAARLLNLADGTVTLLDRLTGTSYDLATQPTVNLTAPAGGVQGRFALVFGATSTVTGTSHLSPLTPYLTVYPNPASSTVRVSGLTGTSVVELLDATGRLVRSQAVGAGSTAVLDLSQLPAGLYMVRSGTSTARLVVE